MEPLSKHTKEQETFPSQKQEVSHATYSNPWEFPGAMKKNLQLSLSDDTPKSAYTLCNIVLVI